jgi:hypothetical protein
MASPAINPERATYRTVVLLRKSEKLKLERLAAKEKISSAEVLRRFIREGDSFFQNKQEEEIIEAALKMISTAAREANESMTRTMDKIDKLHEELMARDIP